MVLVRLQTLSGSRNRTVTFCGGKKELLFSTKAKFSDVHGQDNELYFQIKDDSWGDDVFLDLDDQEIPPKSSLKCSRNTKVEHWHERATVCCRYDILLCTVCITLLAGYEATK